MKRVMRITDEENHTDDYEIFCTFDSDLTNKSYIIYSGYCKDKDGNLLMYAGSYVEEKDGTLRVDKRLTHEENEMISDIIQNIFKQAEKLGTKRKK